MLRVGLVALVTAAALFFALRALGPAPSHESDAPSAMPNRVKSDGGVSRVLVSPREALAAGLAVEKLVATTYQDRASGLGSVVAPQTLAEQRHAYQAAAGDVERSEIAAKAARIGVQRLRSLHRDDRIVSDKALESAQATLATHESNLRLATSQLRLQEMAIRQQWGQVLGSWLSDGSPQLDRIFAGQDLLIQIVLPTGRALADIAYADLAPAPDNRLKATIVSAAPQSDPKFQGQGFFAIAPPDVLLRPGMTVPAIVPLGTPSAGVTVPGAALVRWQGRSWVYVAVSEQEFARRLVEDAIAMPQGWFVASSLAPGTVVVTHGAQLLLSEEVRASPVGGSAR